MKKTLECLHPLGMPGRSQFTNLWRWQKSCRAQSYIFINRVCKNTGKSGQWEKHVLGEGWRGGTEIFVSNKPHSFLCFWLS